MKKLFALALLAVAITLTGCPQRHLASNVDVVGFMIDGSPVYRITDMEYSAVCYLFYSGISCLSLTLVDSGAPMLQEL